MKGENMKDIMMVYQEMSGDEIECQAERLGLSGAKWGGKRRDWKDACWGQEDQSGDKSWSRLDMERL